MNPIVNRLMDLLGKRPPTIKDEAEPFDRDPMAHERERVPSWKRFAYPPNDDRLKFRRHRNRVGKHPI